MERISEADEAMHRLYQRIYVREKLLVIPWCLFFLAFIIFTCINAELIDEPITLMRKNMAWFLPVILFFIGASSVTIAPREAIDRWDQGVFYAWQRTKKLQFLRVFY